VTSTVVGLVYCVLGALWLLDHGLQIRKSCIREAGLGAEKLMASSICSDLAAAQQKFLDFDPQILENAFKDVLPG
jgi:hypothetical protein